jgi:hypothetical protein
MALGLALILLGPLVAGPPGGEAWRIFSDAFSLACVGGGAVAAVLAILAGRERGLGGVGGFLLWLALGMAVGETSPIWLVLFEVVAGAALAAVAALAHLL